MQKCALFFSVFVSFSWSVTYLATSTDNDSEKWNEIIRDSLIYNLQRLKFLSNNLFCTEIATFYPYCSHFFVGGDWFKRYLVAQQDTLRNSFSVTFFRGIRVNWLETNIKISRSRAAMLNLLKSCKLPKVSEQLGQIINFYWSSTTLLWPWCSLISFRLFANVRSASAVWMKSSSSKSTVCLYSLFFSATLLVLNVSWKKKSKSRPGNCLVLPHASYGAVK